MRVLVPGDIESENERGEKFCGAAAVAAPGGLKCLDTAAAVPIFFWSVPVDERAFPLFYDGEGVVRCST